MRMRHAAVVAGLTLLVTSHNAHASLIADVDQVGANVVITVSGKLDISGLTFDGNYTSDGIIAPDNAVISAGDFGDNLAAYVKITGASSFGAGGGNLPTSASGTPFALSGSANEVFIDRSFVNGSSVDAISTFDNATLASLGFKQGSYTYTLPNDTITVNIGNVSAVPLPASAPMFGAALMALGAVGYGLKRKGKAAA